MACLEIITANEPLQLLGLQERRFLASPRAGAAALAGSCAARNSGTDSFAASIAAREKGDMATREGTVWQAPVTFERATGSFPSISRHLNAGEIEGATQQTRQTTDFLKAGLDTPHTTLNFVRHGKVENPTGVV